MPRPGPHQRPLGLGWAWTGACNAHETVTSTDGSVTWRKVDVPPRDIGVLIGLVTGADPVVTVRYLRGPVGNNVAAHEQYRRKGLGPPDLLQVRGDMRVIGRQQGKTRGPENVLGFSVNVLGAAKAVNQNRDDIGPAINPR